jgi:hypothetical protein
VDRRNHLSAKPGQIGRGSTVEPEFFSIGNIQLCIDCRGRCGIQEFRNKKPVQIKFWTGFENMKSWVFKQALIWGQNIPS